MSGWVIYRTDARRSMGRRRRLSVYQLCTEESCIAAYFIWNSGLRRVVGNAVYADSEWNQQRIDRSQFECMSIYEVKKRFETLARIEGHV